MEKNKQLLSSVKLFRLVLSEDCSAISVLKWYRDAEFKILNVANLWTAQTLK